jgi:hypothetical protein
MKHIIEQIPEDEITAFLTLSYSIGGFLLFPGNRVDNKGTINQDRGTNRQICDRIDLTLESIRLYYMGFDSPLSATFHRYEGYFRLFDSFRGYCEFFLLHDLVVEDFSTVKFFLPFQSFEKSPLPQSVEEYYVYKNNNMNFLKERNRRIVEYDK